MSRLGSVFDRRIKPVNNINCVIYEKDIIPEEFNSQIFLNKSLHEQNDYLVKALSQPSFKWLSDFIDKILKPHA